MMKKILFAAITFITASWTYVGGKSITDYPDLERYTMGAQRPDQPKAMRFAPDGKTYLQLSDDGCRIVRYDIRTAAEVETVMDVAHTRDNTLASPIEDFTISPEGSKLLVWVDRQEIYRHSFSARYYVYEIRTRQLYPLSDDQPRQQTPLFSPDGRMVAFAGSDRNIYIRKLDYRSQVAVTVDGAYNAISNGVPDWTYEEEFATTCSMTWSPDNLMLCYLRYDETDVPLYSFPLYKGSCGPMKSYALYPGSFSYKYPVAGENNSKVRVRTYDVETRKTKEVEIPGTQTEYVPRIAYGQSPERLMITTLNRDQTRMELFCANPRSTVVKSVLVEQWKAWLNPATYENIRYLDDSFVVASSRTGYLHLYQYTYAGAMMRTLTSGDYDTDGYYGYDSATGSHYYRACIDSSMGRVLCRLDGKGKVTMLSPEKGTVSATFSPDMAYFTSQYSTVRKPPVYTLYATSQPSRPLRVLCDNAAYASQWVDVPLPEFFTMPESGTSPSLNGYVIKPTGFNPSQRYPVIMYQYSGPGSQEVADRWKVGFENYFARAGYVVVCVDGRGTGYRGRAFMDVVYKNLGRYETIDQIAAARYAASLPYVDASRIAIFGWSYGGYEAIMASSANNAPYAAAVAVAPVTDWRFYDTVYAERYMLTPGQNPDGYASSSTIGRINNRRCDLLIMHGTADDNVHLYNTMHYVSEAESLGHWCDMLMFPNMNHSINGCNARAVVIARLLDYLDSHMK